MVVGGDHPRLRGEQKHIKKRLERGYGSPPLARGTGFSRIDNAGAIRITPACAGNRKRQEETT